MLLDRPDSPLSLGTHDHDTPSPDPVAPPASVPGHSPSQPGTVPHRGPVDPDAPATPGQEDVPHDGATNQGGTRAAPLDYQRELGEAQDA